MAVASDLFNEAVVIDTVEVVEEENDDSEKAVEIKENGLLKDTGATDVWWALSSGYDYDGDPTILYIGNSQADVEKYGVKGKQITGPTTSWKQSNRWRFIYKVIFVSKVRPTDTNGWFSSGNITSIEDMAAYLDTSEVTAMNSMFAGCGCVPDLSGFDTSKVTDMNNMFAGMECTALDVSSFDTSHVTDLSSMFSRCTSLTTLDLSDFDTSSATDMSQMFEECGALQTIYAGKGFVTDSATSSGGMFAACSSLKGGAGTTYDSAHTGKEYARIDGGTTVPGYFTAKNYTVTFASNGGSTVNPQTVLALDTVQKPADPEKEQFAFAGWHKDEALQEEWNFDTDKVKTNITLYAKWTVKDDTAYKVEHKQQNADGNGYTLKDTDNLTGTTGAKTAAAAKSYDGFTAGTVTQADIAADGSTVVEIKYDRIEYTITYDANGHGTAPTATTARYGAPVSAPTAPETAGYTFGGWYEEAGCENEYAFSTMPLNGKTVYAKWTANGNTAYKVEHKQQNADGNGYTLKDTDNLTGTTGAKTAAAAKSYDGFTAGTVTQADIAADGSTVVEIKYDRNQYTITYNANGHGTAPEATTALYGATVSAPTDPETAGYSFGGWYEDAACTTAYAFTVMPLGGKTVYAKWTKNDDPKPDPKPTPVYNDSKEEREPLFTGTWNNPVTRGSWSQDQNGVWHYTSSETFRYTWAYILNPYAKAGQHTSDWFWFDRQGNMLTGWQFINGKWYYLNPTKDGTLGACQLGGVTPDGWTVDESGAWIESIPKK